MWQRLKLLKDLLGVYLNRRHGMAFLERVQASNLGEADRDLVTRILRAALRLPDAPGKSRLRLKPPINAQRHAIVTATRPDRAWLDKITSTRDICLVASWWRVPVRVAVAKDAWCKSP